MYSKYDERELFMYNMCSSCKFVREFKTYWFSKFNGFHYHRISELTGLSF